MIADLNITTLSHEGNVVVKQDNTEFIFSNKAYKTKLIFTWN